MDLLRSPAPCPHCGSFLAVGSLRCDSCGRPTLSADQLTRTRKQAHELALRWADSPYLRDAARNAYTLRSRARGFLKKTSHPLVQDLLSSLEELMEDCPPGQRPFLLHHFIHEGLAKETAALGRLVEETLRIHRDRLPPLNDDH